MKKGNWFTINEPEDKPITLRKVFIKTGKLEVTIKLEPKDDCSKEWLENNKPNEI